MHENFSFCAENKSNSFFDREVNIMARKLKKATNSTRLIAFALSIAVKETLLTSSS